MAIATLPMHIVMFAQSFRSDWNHGHAHFLRGVAAELQRRGHTVRVYEPIDGWSARGLIEEAGAGALSAYREAYPTMSPIACDLARFDLDEALDRADVVIAHEGTAPELIARLGRARSRGGSFRLLFHDTHHRSATKPTEMAALDLSGFDGVLAFGDVLRREYERAGWARRAWTWHEAADTSVFRPLDARMAPDDLVWIGNWGDDERRAELHEFLLEPARALELTGSIYGVRYPPTSVDAVTDAGLAFRGYLPNHHAPAVYARHCLTVHVPRRPYATSLPGIPTIRVFEALACGIPLVSAPWHDEERLFSIGDDFLMATHGDEMQACIRDVLYDDDLATHLAAHGLRTIRTRHTCAHRVDELCGIVATINAESTAPV